VGGCSCIFSTAEHQAASLNNRFEKTKVRGWLLPPIAKAQNGKE
jgi:hypothetical protein